MNLRDRHISSKKCIDNARARDVESKKTQSSLAGFLRPKAKIVPPTVSAPSLINQTGVPLLVPSLSQPGERVVNPCGPLDELEKLIPRLISVVSDVGLGPDNGLGAFGSNPVLLDDPSIASKDLWEEVLNGIMHRAFWGKDDSQLDIMVRREGRSLPDFCCFVCYFTEKQGIDLALFRPRIDDLIHAIKSM